MSPPLHLEGLDTAMNSRAPGDAISGNCLQMVGVDAKRFEGLFQNVFEPLLLASMGSSTGGQLAIENLARKTIFWHPYDVSHPAQSSVDDVSLDGVDVCAEKDFMMGNVFPPG